MRFVTWLLFVAAILMPLPALAQESRVALVIGNSRYESSPLVNPARDAQLMSSTLKAVGFEVTTVIDGDQKQIKAAIRDFGQRIKGGIALFYYAGHGMQVDGNNYLIPVNAKIEAQVDVDVEAVNVSAVLAAMEKSRASVNIVILDACRDNPFARETRSGVRGLAFVNAPQGTLISYATAPGNVASDGEGQNGTYTASLSKHIGTPGLAVEEMFKRVRGEVRDTTKGKQIPWESSSLIGSFAFVGSGEAPVVGPDPAPQPSREQEHQRRLDKPGGDPRRDEAVPKEDSPEVAQSRSLRSRVRAFAGVIGGVADHGAVGDYTQTPTSGNEYLNAHSMTGPYFGAGGGARVGLTNEWQLNLPAYVSYKILQSSGDEIEVSGMTRSDEAAYLNQLTFTVAPTIRYHFADPLYAGLGGYLGVGMVDFKGCDADAEFGALCDRQAALVPDMSILIGGLLEVGVVLLPEEQLNLAPFFFIGTTTLASEELGGGLAASWAVF